MEEKSIIILRNLIALGRVKTYRVGKKDSLVLVIPKAVRQILNINPGDCFTVCIDAQNKDHIIYVREV